MWPFVRRERFQLRIRRAPTPIIATKPANSIAEVPGSGTYGWHGWALSLPPSSDHEASNELWSFPTPCPTTHSQNF
jgi:hypothetical protein